ncbi:MAG: zinc dependent phospholipase C family protein [Clostridia bacterium]|nr:zinc dependent phospholipase C family protein [Clostridia bacterium]
MATWGVHLRIAGSFFDKIPKEHHREFVIGSVAPDCGYGRKDSFGEFEPPPKVTHWSPSGAKKDCRYKDFYAEYLTGERNDDYWFYLGYYIHLLTDIMCSVTMYLPTRIKYKAQYDRDPHFLGTIKKDWNDIDAAHLQKISEHPIYDIIRAAGEVKDYLPYYENGQLTKQIKYIADYYMNYGEVLPREYKYTTEAEIENFIACASELLKKVAENEKLL